VLELWMGLRLTSIKGKEKWGRPGQRAVTFVCLSLCLFAHLSVYLSTNAFFVDLTLYTIYYIVMLYNSSFSFSSLLLLFFSLCVCYFLNVFVLLST
jgi:hypothetical protein